MINTQNGNTKDLALVISILNLLEGSNNYSKSLSFHFKSEIPGRTTSTDNVKHFRYLCKVFQ